MYFQIRNQENAEIEAGALKAARLVTDQAYCDLLDVLDALHILDPKALHPAVWKQLDELVDYYKQYYINRKSSKKKDDDDEPSDDDVKPESASDGESKE